LTAVTITANQFATLWTLYGVCKKDPVTGLHHREVIKDFPTRTAADLAKSALC
jgi:hypothetical protein